MLVDTAPPAAETRRTPRFGFLRSWDTAIILALVASIIVASMTVSGFATSRNVGFLLIDVIPVLLLALPMTLIIVTGEIDLSVASIAGLSAACSERSGTPGCQWKRSFPCALSSAPCPGHSTDSWSPWSACHHWP